MRFQIWFINRFCWKKKDEIILHRTFTYSKQWFCKMMNGINSQRNKKKKHWFINSNGIKPNIFDRRNEKANHLKKKKQKKKKKLGQWHDKMTNFINMRVLCNLIIDLKTNDIIASIILFHRFIPHLWPHKCLCYFSIFGMPILPEQSLPKKKRINISLISATGCTMNSVGT